MQMKWPKRWGALPNWVQVQGISINANYAVPKLVPLFAQHYGVLAAAKSSSNYTAFQKFRSV